MTSTYRTRTGIWSGTVNELTFTPYKSEEEKPFDLAAAFRARRANQKQELGLEPEVEETESPTQPPIHEMMWEWTHSKNLTDLLSYLGQKTWVTKRDLVVIADLWEKYALHPTI
jgi:hypothetical protein